jgi:aspartate/methionine/tyrosine aminotransferase
VACVPGSSFFEDPRDGANFVRFCFCKKHETLHEASRRLRTWGEANKILA